MKAKTTNTTPNKTTKSIRCAIYTRKSTEEGLEKEFNTLDAQREAGEAYIRSQQHEGWVCLPEKYDDGGFTGGNMDRPALKQLLTDMEQGKIDAVVVYKVDRLSRSLLDFARIMQLFDEKQIAFVSVTQQFNTGNSMGRLMLNVLLSFAQFEREIISERTRDKIAATRRKGKWSGGRAVLGYDVVDRKLVVHPGEAERVRTIFQMYLQSGSLRDVIEELAVRGWLSKMGKPFQKTTLHHLLTNILYVGKVRYREECHPGEHPGIVDIQQFERVQLILQRQTRRQRKTGSRSGALLQGLVFCRTCECRMTPTHTKKGNRKYRYYVCTNAQRRGFEHCPTKQIPAQPVEDLVVNQLQRISTDDRLIARILTEAEQQDAADRDQLLSERRVLDAEHRSQAKEFQVFSRTLKPDDAQQRQRLVQLQERMQQMEGRLTALTAKLQSRVPIDIAGIRRALVEFRGVWSTLVPREQSRVLNLLVERIDYDAERGTVLLSFHSQGFEEIAELTVGMKGGMTV